MSQDTIGSHTGILMHRAPPCHAVGGVTASTERILLECRTTSNLTTHERSTQTQSTDCDLPQPTPMEAILRTPAIFF